VPDGFCNPVRKVSCLGDGFRLAQNASGGVTNPAARAIPWRVGICNPDPNVMSKSQPFPCTKPKQQDNKPRRACNSLFGSKPRHFGMDAEIQAKDGN